jgi:hypothetical protein
MWRELPSGTVPGRLSSSYAIMWDVLEAGFGNVEDPDRNQGEFLVTKDTFEFFNIILKSRYFTLSLFVSMKNFFTFEEKPPTLQREHLAFKT